MQFTSGAYKTGRSPHHSWNAPFFWCTAWPPCSSRGVSWTGTHRSFTCNLHPKAPLVMHLNPAPGDKHYERRLWGWGEHLVAVDVEKSVATIPQLTGQSSSMKITAESYVLFVLDFNFSTSGCPWFSHTYLAAKLMPSKSKYNTRKVNRVSFTYNRSQCSHKLITKSEMFPTCLFL